MAKRKKRATKKRTTRKKVTKRAPKAKRAKVRVSKTLYAIASPRSLGGVSMFDALDRINCETVQNFFSAADVTSSAVSRLKEAGFDVLQVTPSMINIAGTAAMLEPMEGT